VTLQRLVEKGAAVIEQTDPPKYAPVAPETLAGACRTSFLADIRTLLRAAEAQFTRLEDAHIWCVIGRANVLGLASELIREAERSIRVEADPRDLQALLASLDEARGRVGVELFEPRRGTSLTAQTRNLVVLSDDQRILAGTTEPDEDCRAVSTKNAGLVTLGLNYFRKIESAAVPSDVTTARGRLREDWLAWEDRKHRDLVGSLN
jgi:sugar-specific transcriptional regulator TrmB